MTQPEKLDRTIDPRERVAVRLVFPTIKAYNKKAEALKQIAEDAEATGAVSMI